MSGWIIRRGPANPASRRVPTPRAVQPFTESPNRSKYLFLRNSGRKTVTHFSWNCFSPSCRPECRCRAAPAIRTAPAARQ
ncbi:MAG: hypothetical protein E5X49_08575 [Mesorhizobium sp.]|nr:MAG: hypothetical protein EOQ28_16840 [Mesorhizobium sp.]RWC05473.1 MAG: hypothetical protein EOQ57_03750 [Mesorhizobium sp.]RWG84348.1 MAG: hypothetical protein EOQ69_11875 [Mesorhizobium sp.]RWG89408.1 MAG: hypothetical protein EOQ70_07770 [Mesorhizobium sp.]RWK07717.1 MAG: hypothetical protein EOR42_06790 [Mesorhizobium sp.]